MARVHARLPSSRVAAGAAAAALLVVAVALLCACAPPANALEAPTPYPSRRARTHAAPPNFWETPDFLGEALGNAFQTQQEPRDQRRMHAPSSRFRQVLPKHMPSRRANAMAERMGRSFGSAPELTEISAETRKSLPYGAKRDGSFMEVMNSMPLPTRYAEDPFGNAEESAPAMRHSMPTQVQVFKTPGRYEAPSFDEVLDQLTDIHAPSSFLQMKTRSRAHPFVPHQVVAAPSFKPPLAPPPPPRRGPPPPRALSELDERTLISPAAPDSMPLLETGASATLKVRVIDMNQEQQQVRQQEQQHVQQQQQQMQRSLGSYQPAPAAKKPVVWYVGPQGAQQQQQQPQAQAQAQAPKGPAFNNGVMLETAASAARVAKPSQSEPVLALMPPTVVHVLGHEGNNGAQHVMDEDEHELWD